MSLLLCLAALHMGHGASGVGQSTSATNLDKEAAKCGVVRLVLKDRTPVGTGFIISVSEDRIVIVTAAHVTTPNPAKSRPALSAEFYKNNGDPIVTTLVQAEDPDRSHSSLSVLSVARKLVKSKIYPLLLTRSAPDNGDSVAIIGNPSGKPWQVENALSEGVENGMLIINRNLAGGYSGSPVISSSSGKVVGLVAFAQGAKTESVPASIISDYLKANNVSLPEDKKIEHVDQLGTVDVGGDTVTDISVEKGDVVRASATGRVHVGAYVGEVTPDGKTTILGGIPIAPKYNLVVGYPHGCLLWRVKGESDWKRCGSAGEMQANRAGNLEFNINDSDQSDDSGSFQVSVSVKRGT